MHRFFLPRAQCGSDSLVLDGGEAHHALRVLRLRQGDKLTILDGHGREYLSEIVATDKQKISLRLIEARSHPEPQCRVTLLQAVPKGKLIETIIQKATELGAYRVIPLVTERVVHRYETKQALEKGDQWQQVAIEAIKQCGAPWLPRVEGPQTPEQFLAKREVFDLPLLASLQSNDHPRNHFEAFRATHRRQPASVCIWIGPEGDFTPEELQVIQASGARPITLGPLVLRTDTAASYCLSFIQYETLHANEVPAD
jgi:16S rRNA (uracil1498-N3)-methyltransferase